MGFSESLKKLTCTNILNVNKYFAIWRILSDAEIFESTLDDEHIDYDIDPWLVILKKVSLPLEKQRNFLLQFYF